MTTSLFPLFHKYRPLRYLAVTALAASLLSGCSGNTNPDENSASPAPLETPAQVETQPADQAVPAGADVNEQPSTVFYELFVRSFYDSDGDGIGDLRGVIEKLDYLNDGNPETTDDLGIGGIWLMPINPSPSYHGYDVSDYRDINPDYGTLKDFQELMDEAHKRGIKVVMDLIVNHTSTEHPWFKASSSDLNSKYRDWYIWAEDQNRPLNGVSAAGSSEPWHPSPSLPGVHYMGTFWGGMPDLNFDNPAVRAEMKDISKFWLDKGVDGFRLDAAKHIYEDLVSDRSEATTAKNVSWWQEFRKAVKEVNPEAYLVGEVWENSAATVGAYMNQAFDSSFNFGLSEKLISSVKNEKDSGIAYTLERTYKLYAQLSEGAFTDATFLSNHDINRAMSQLENNADHAKMAAALLLTLPGNPFIYYGEEIGMLGMKPDEAIREPMMWTQGGLGKGQTTWEEAALNAKAANVSVESQTSDDNSLLSRYRELISIRNEVPALRDGGIRDYTSGNKGVMAFERVTAEQQVLVLHNLSGDPQQVTLQANANGASYTHILKDISKAAVLDDGKLALPPYSTVILD